MDYRISREKMVDRHILARGITNPHVIRAMRRVPRHMFVEEALRGQCYSDRSLPIGEKQTISQPYIVALMTQSLELGPTDTVLEIGTGSGYQTAVLAELAFKVYSLERIPSLLRRARKILDSLGYVNTLLWQGDGTLGWKEYAPYDAIVVTAGAPELPEPLLDQLAEGGRLVAPVGERSRQELVRVTRSGDAFTCTRLSECRFVDLVGEHGWKR